MHHWSIICHHCTWIFCTPIGRWQSNLGFLSSSPRFHSAHLGVGVTCCITSVASWMRSDCLQQNADKTDFIWCSFACRKSSFRTDPVNVDSVDISPLSTVCDIGGLYWLRTWRHLACLHGHLTVFCRLTAAASTASGRQLIVSAFSMLPLIWRTTCGVITISLTFLPFCTGFL